jgi:leucyl aminopeptidase
MEKEMVKYHGIELAFSKIKGSTGNSDVKEMVTKFMTKEQTYATLLSQVGKGEKRFEELKSKNEEKRKLLQELQIVHDGKENLNGPPPKNERDKEKKETLMR